MLKYAIPLALCCAQAQAAVVYEFVGRYTTVEAPWTPEMLVTATLTLSDERYAQLEAGGRYPGTIQYGSDFESVEFDDGLVSSGALYEATFTLDGSGFLVGFAHAPSGICGGIGVLTMGADGSGTYSATAWGPCPGHHDNDGVAEAAGTWTRKVTQDGPTPVPLPAGIWLMASALPLLGLRRR